MALVLVKINRLFGMQIPAGMIFIFQICSSARKNIPNNEVTFYSVIAHDGGGAAAAAAAASAFALSANVSCS